MSDLHVIVISSVRPEPTSAGQVVLHRHLVGQPGVSLEVHGQEPTRLTVRSLFRKLIGRLGTTRLRVVSATFWALWRAGWLDEHLPPAPRRDTPAVVLTVAHGDACHAARRYAKRYGLPLVVWFQDWWPDCVQAPAWVRKRIERDFRALYAEAALAICVCEGMRNELGDHSNSVVLHDLSHSVPLGKAAAEHRLRRKPFQVQYFGNLTEYGPMLAEAVQESLKHQDLLLRVRGSRPAWDAQFASQMEAQGRLLPFAPREELNQWLAEADAFLVPMVFNPRMRRRMETSFPSKLIEFAQFGRPLVVWGPEYCSAVIWAVETRSALCVTDPDASAVMRALRELSESPQEQALWTTAARRAANQEFNPKKIRCRFAELLGLQNLVKTNATNITHD